VTTTTELKRMLEKSDLSQSALARAAGVSQSYVSRLLAGRIPNADRRTVARILAVLSPKAPSKYCATGVQIYQGLHIDPGVYDLGEGFFASHAPPAALDSTWKEWLGTIMADEVAAVTLWLWAEQPADRPEVLDDQDERIRLRCRALWNSLLLHRVPAVERCFRIRGTVHAAPGVAVRSAGRVDRPNRSTGAIPRVDVPLLEQAAQTAGYLADLVETGRWGGRLARGFHWLHRAWHAPHVEEAHLATTLALDALLATAGDDQHWVRASNLLGDEVAEPQVLVRRVLQFRDGVLRLREVRSALGIDDREIAEARGLAVARDARQLAATLYLRVVRDPRLVELFTMETEVEDAGRRFERGDAGCPLGSERVGLGNRPEPTLPDAQTGSGGPL